MSLFERKIFCSKCNLDTNHEIIHTYKRSTSEFDDIQWFHEFHITECAGCETVAFIDHYGDEEMWEYNYDGEREYIYDTKVYPPKPIVEKEVFYARVEAIDFKFASESVKELYLQVVNAYNSGFLLLATIGLRTLIEKICIDINVKKGFKFDDNQVKIPDDDGTPRKKETIEGKINELWEKQYIIWDQARILQKIRKIANSAVHGAEEPTTQAFRSAINIVEQLVINVYELKNHKLLK
ncbi:protein of unknown function [Terribacillus halophilus]|uniref:DUF4145 domain-containing protein n=1 Tax=Terribacillus halophilus TaxID=361279 RepID=A0A1G6PNE9_9BACI|nr:DUF4145 domain-containing protein [Terribacillus halophilus]SDC80865.1 protein of unknown function [Terribacillus halophilus]